MKNSFTLVLLLLICKSSFGQIIANNDYGTPLNATSLNENTVITNILSNDVLNGVATTLSDVTIIQLSTTNINFNLNSFTGSVTLNPGTETSTYIITYQICEISNPTNCSTATIALIFAADDNNVNFTSSVCNETIFDSNLIFGNDSLNGNPIIVDQYIGNNYVLGNVNVTFLSNNFYCTINNQGNISIYNNNNQNLYELVTYFICDKLNPNICDSGTFYAFNSEVHPFAQNDDFSSQPISNTTGGTTLNSVLTNDYNSCGLQSSLQCFALNFPTGITLNIDGTIHVNAGTSPGNYLLNYSVSDGINGGYSQAQVILVITSSSTLKANYDNFNQICSNDTFANVMSNDQFNYTIIDIANYTVTAINPPAGISLNQNGTISIATFVTEGIYYLRYQLCSNSNPLDCNISFAYLAVVKNKISGEIKLGSNGFCSPYVSESLNNIKIKNIIGNQTYYSNSYNALNNNSPKYYVLADIGQNTISLPNIPTYFNVDPNPKIVNLTNSCEYSNYESFCVWSNSSVNDLEVILIADTQSRPGYVTNYRTVIKNNGSTILSGTVTIFFENNKMSFVSSSPSPISSTSNSITINFSNLNPFQTTVIFPISFQIFTNPAVNLGTILNFTTTLNPIINDATTSNNTNILLQTVVDSLDPNDIVVHEGENITLNQAQQDYLHYTIRFQNIGTSNAINVKLINELDNKLDWNSMEILSSSHNFRLKQKNNSAEFLFENINLPGTNNEALSHGYITYKIKPISTIAIGNVIPNTANIYFDYNAPITTNTASTTILNNLQNNNFTFNNFTFYPNPVKDNLKISNNSVIDSVEILSLLGQKMIAKNVNSLETEISLSELSSGIYFVKVISNGQEKTVKIVKE